MMEERTIPDHEFVIELRIAIERYLCAVDQLETANRDCLRMSGYPDALTRTPEAERLEYHERRHELEVMLPRVQRLCATHRLPNPFTGLLPPPAAESAVGRSVRGAVSRALMELHSACIRYDRIAAHLMRASLVQRLVNYFS